MHGLLSELLPVSASKYIGIVERRVGQKRSSFKVFQLPGGIRNKFSGMTVTSGIRIRMPVMKPRPLSSNEKHFRLSK